MFQKRQTTLTAYLPIQISYVMNFDVSFNTIEEICSLEDKLEFPLENFGNVLPSIALIETSEIKDKIVLDALEEVLPKYELARPDYILKISTTIEYIPTTDGFVDNKGEKQELSIDDADEYQ